MKYVLLCLIIVSNIAFCQITDNTKSLQKKGFIDLEDGSVATSLLIRNTVSSKQYRIWYGSDSVGLGPNKYRCFVNLGAFAEANTWEMFDVSGRSENETGVYNTYKTDSSLIYVGSNLYRQFIEYKAKMKIYVDAPNSAGPGRRLIYNDILNLNYIENKRWKKAL
jgi:hypothetical protein